MPRRSIALLGAALLAACACSAARPGKAPEKEGLDTPPGLSVLYMNPAVDHVVTYSWWRGFGPKGGDRVTLRRHGPWVREDQELIGSKRPVDAALTTTYSNIATAASFGTGENRGFTLWNGSSTTGRYRLVRTSESKTIAGERCSIWRGEPIDPDRGVDRRGCITDDGIVLYESWLYSSGEIADEQIALKVERRKVAAAEVLPPRNAMNWPAWLTGAGRLGSAPTGKPENYDVRLERSDGGAGRAEKLRYRGSGGWQSSEEWREGRLERFFLSHSSGRLWLHKVARQISISSDVRARPFPIGQGVEPIDRPAQRILGEDCRWFDTTVNVQDYSRHECRSADGLPLAIVEGGRGGGPSYRAVSVSRGKTPLRDVMPPSGLLGWTRWGWPELDR